MNERNTLLKQIQAVDFALYETQLYLDGHPNCRKALAYYTAHLRTAEKLKAEYAEKFGPLTANAVKDPNHFTWIDGPWPWEKEAN